MLPQRARKGDNKKEEKNEALVAQISELNKGRQDPGKWELFTITVDSGAAESVAPPDAANTFPLVETQATKDGLYYISATGDRVYNEGERRVTVTMPDGHQQSMMYQVAEVNKVLASVSRICEGGRERVVFEKNNNYIENIQTGRRTHMKENNGVYIIEAWIDRTADFGRQGTETC